MLQEEYQGMIEGSATVEEYLLSNLKCDKSLIFATMNRFNFDYEDRLKKIDLLSPGERTRLYLLICSLKEINTLVLDEPTNYLDIEALDAIEDVISDFEGIIIASSHDRYFIEHFNPTITIFFDSNGTVQKK